MTVFADTSYWIALLAQRDDFHERAVVLSRKFRPQEIITTNFVLIEFLNWFSDRGPLREAAVKAVRALRSGPTAVTLSWQSEKEFDAALKMYGDVTDKSWSLTDCASFLIMESLGIRSALTHDRHFEQAGFEALLR